MIAEQIYNGNIAHTGGFSEKVVAGWAAATLFLTSISFVFILRIPYIIGIGIGLIVVDVLLHKRVYFDYNIGIIALVAAFLFMLAFGVIPSKAPQYGHEKLTVVTGWVLYFLLMAGYLKRQLPFFLKSTVVLGLVYIALLAYQFGDPFTFFRTATVNDQRLGLNYQEGGEIFNPIWLSRYIGVLILSYVCYSGRFTLTGIAIYTVSALYMVSAASKGPIVALLVAIVGYMVAIGRISRRTCWMILIVTGSFLVLGSAAIEASGNQYLSQRYSIFGSSGGDRFHMIGELYNDLYLNGNIFFGKGTGGAGYLLNGNDMRGYPHNILMEVFYENGVLGMGVLLALLLIALSQAGKKKEWADIVGFHFFLFFLLNALFSGDLEFNQYLFLFTFVMISGNRTVLL